MNKIILILSCFSFISLRAEVLNLQSRIYGGDLFHNERATGKACYVQINEVTENEQRGKYCHDLTVQMMFGLDEIGVHPREMELLLQSRRTNNDTEFHLPGTCAEVTGDVAKPYEIDRWGDDTTHLYNQVFAAEYKVNKRKNDYILNFKSSTKAPNRAMIHRTTWLKEDSYECRNLIAM
jgi:hypothetical protein